MNLEEMGWDDDRQAEAAAYPTLAPARVLSQAGPNLVVDDGQEEREAVVPGRVRRAAATPEALPVVGDWVLIDHTSPPRIQAILMRRSSLRRKTAGTVSVAQVLAANVDVVFIVMAADAVNARRVERMLSAAWESGATPVLLLTKIDLNPASGEVATELRALAPGVDLLPVATFAGTGVEAVGDLLTGARTGVLLGPSGVGKSTLVNRLLGADAVATGAVRSDGKGRHTTVRREIHQLPGGGLLVDTPGIRELQLWGDDGDSLALAFPDIDDLAANCRFSDCRHQAEPGCAVLAAVAAGRLQPNRLDSMRRLRAELASIERRVNARRRAEATRNNRELAKSMRRAAREKEGTP
ncbi:MAG: ribosome small subunit-dependent GTPase A [Candidatus Dormibacteria bacterium]